MVSLLHHQKLHDPHFKIFHELMSFKVQEILLVSSPYDAFIMEEDGSLASRIINEYHGLNLSRPPRITWVPSGEKALDLLAKSRFDLIVSMPRLGKMDCSAFACNVKRLYPEIPIILLAHSANDAMAMEEVSQPSCFDDSYIWCCDSDILLAIVKNTEDRHNAAKDTRKAMVRVILLVEDSPVHRSVLLPLLYGELVRQTQEILDDGLNDQHRLLKMRARPKILTASTYEEAIALYQQFQPYIFCVLSDVRFARAGKEDATAGYHLLREIRRLSADLPLLMLSTESQNKNLAERIPAVFIEKTRENMQEIIRDFLLNYLGFGDFVFRSPDGLEVDRATRLREFEQSLRTLPHDSLFYHANCNHFSNWVMARAEILLAARLHKDIVQSFTDGEELREYLIKEVHDLRKLRQQGVVTQFSAATFDQDITDFTRMGNGSLGGKARGIAFMFSLLTQPFSNKSLFTENQIKIPQTCVITSQGFDDFIRLNNLYPDNNLSDQKIKQRFINSELPHWLLDDLTAFLKKIRYPLSVRSSGLLEDAQYRPYAGLYQTYMLANKSPDINTRLAQLVEAVKLVYASTWFESPRSFTRSVGQNRHDSMAVIIQQLAGSQYGHSFYPAISGVAKSYNYYPIAPMQAEDGIAHVALGFGKTVVEGGKSLRFSPAFPNHLPQFSTVDDILANSQRTFYCLDTASKMPREHNDSNLMLSNIDQAGADYPVRFLSSTYIPEEHRIRDTDLPGPKVITFASVLKYRLYPLPEILQNLLASGRKGMGCEVEIEFAVDIPDASTKPVFYFLQIRPIVSGSDAQPVIITEQEKKQAFLFSSQVLGHGHFNDIQDIIFVAPEQFDRSSTLEIAAEISRINNLLHKEKTPFLLIGPGRWGTADRWLGIPVEWKDISGVAAIVEVQDGSVAAEPSQGTHFFQNITSLGIPYLTTTTNLTSRQPGVNWQWLSQHKSVEKGKFVSHIRLEKPFVLKVDGTSSIGIALYP
jgi:CheY-like chemotaxis protein